MSSVQSIERAFAILQRLATGPSGVTELAERVDLPKSTVSRLLSTLEQLGAVRQTSSGGPYEIGPVIVEIASTALPKRGLAERAHPYLVELTRATGEATGFSVRTGESVHYLDQVESDNPVQVRDWTGTSAPLHAVPSGLVLLAFAPPGEQATYLTGSLDAFTNRTMTDPTAIATRLTEIRAKGYAWVYEEFSEGINSVAAPIFDEDSKVIAAVHAHGPAYRFPADRTDHTERVGRLVAAAAREIERSLRR